MKENAFQAARPKASYDIAREIADMLFVEGAGDDDGSDGGGGSSDSDGSSSDGSAGAAGGGGHSHGHGHRIFGKIVEVRGERDDSDDVEEGGGGVRGGVGVGVGVGVGAGSAGGKENGAAWMKEHGSSCGAAEREKLLA